MTAPRPLPPGHLVAYYGDDFTGASAVMEATEFAGLETVLFLDVPSPERLAAFANYRVIGIAGVARSKPPSWMQTHLPDIFRALQEIRAPISHYKVCSTFDSSPEIGSIGCAIDVASGIFASSWVPMIVADPGMARFQAFGHLYASAGGRSYRLDRHPVMSRHPVTPMREADLCRHLAHQTSRQTGLVDVTALKRGDSDALLARERASGAEIISIDVLDQETLIAAGRLVWEQADDRAFAVGSQGLEAALVAYWQAAGMIPKQTASRRASPADRIVAVSGSVSPTTAAQIAAARDGGLATVPLDAACVVDERRWQGELARVTAVARAAFDAGRDPVIHTAAGPDDPAVATYNAALATAGMSPEAANERIGIGLGLILRGLLEATNVRRAIICGGDTSGRAASVLGIDALTAIAPIAPGAPLCRAHASTPFDGLEIALKGGQVGAPDFILATRLGVTSTTG